MGKYFICFFERVLIFFSYIYLFLIYGMCFNINFWNSCILIISLFIKVIFLWVFVLGFFLLVSKIKNYWSLKLRMYYRKLNIE